MQLFVTSPDPCAAARCLDDKRVVKITLEAAQVICTVLHQQGRPAPYKPTHQHHPITLWAGQNLPWVWAYLAALASEYQHRFGREHLSWTKLRHLAPAGPAPVPGAWCNCSGITLPCVFASYRLCLNAKWQADSRAPKWTRREPPAWRIAV